MARAPRRPVTVDPSPPPTAAARRLGEPELLAVLAIAITLLHTWLARAALNPDGVSYLDLARVLAAGDRSAFVQGYWSPLYPALIALFSKATGPDPVSMVAIAHAINGTTSIAAIVFLWGWSRQIARPFFARALIATYLLISAGLPRIETVTPDIVLLALMTWIGYELLVHRGERTMLMGILLGAAFLTKTSAWPWLLLAVPIRLWGARDAVARRGVYLSSAVCAAVMLLWVVPLSLKTGHVTLGSSGRLNYAWYIDASDARTPDTHGGQHRAYHTFAVDPTRTIDWAEYPGAGRWTYEPWSDPTAWDEGILTRRSSPPTPWELASYWGRMARVTFGLWLLPVLLAVLVPLFLLDRRPVALQRLWHEDRAILVVAMLGLAGVLQFILIHSEPRLIAPFAMLFALAVLHERATGTPSTPRYPPWVQRGGMLIGILTVVGFAAPRLSAGIESSARISAIIASIAPLNATLAAAGLSQSLIVVVGPAIPVDGSAFLTGSHIVAQVLPRSIGVLKEMTPEERNAVLTRIFADRAQIAWLTTSDANVSMVVLRPEETPPAAPTQGGGRALH